MTRMQFLDAIRALHPSTQAWLVVVASLGLMVLFMTFGQSREYYFGLTDGEHDYYYNAKVILADGVPPRALHPGTPIYYLGAVILAIVGDEQERAQVFFNTAYIVGFLSLAGAMWFFVRWVLSDVGFGWSILVLATIAIWPPTGTYLNHFTGDLYILSATVVVLGYFWRFLDGSEINQRQLAVFGVLIGIAMAVKSNFLLMAVPIVASMAVHFLRISRGEGWLVRLREVATRLILVGAVALLAFVVSVAPALPRLYSLVKHLKNKATRSDTAASDLFDQLGSFIETAPMYSLGFLAAVIFAVVVSVMWFKSGSSWKRVNWTRQEQELQDPVAIITFLAVGGFLLVFTIVGQLHVSAPAGSTEVDPGIRTRDITPIAMFLPLALLGLRELWRVGGYKISRFAPRPGLVSPVLVTVAALAVMWTFTDYARYRSEVFGEMRTELAARNEALEDLSGDGRLAIWGWGAGMGVSTFHFWGNYFYAYDRFDSELLVANPDFTFVRLHFGDLLDRGRQAGLSSSSVAELREMLEPREFSANPIKQIFQRWEARFPYPDRTTEIFAGENNDVDVAKVVLIGEDLAVSGIDPVGTLNSLLPSRFGATDVSIIEVGDETWTVFSIER
jgi:hypothetical protein